MTLIRTEYGYYSRRHEIEINDSVIKFVNDFFQEQGYADVPAITPEFIAFVINSNTEIPIAWSGLKFDLRDILNDALDNYFERFPTEMIDEVVDVDNTTFDIKEDN